ncbi:hypothetical protein HO133_009933 [Letharia lupina]|uniref:Uncharacterized protein n=1 Tax=Letharia lupina TaxID=560253 RepID=A0A8H6CJY2_9LECA|nr:uncharacterized protein HO133_009933 [Letharia lupina]KAF6224740.1 hypothetical protein HO133_009933 [Letharia lupina]
MHALSLLCTIEIACCVSTALAASVPVHSESTKLAAGTPPSLPFAALDTVNLTTPQTSPWPRAPWAYKIPGHSPQHLVFEEISAEDTGLEGQQSTLHACDEVVRWLWENYKADQNIDHAGVQTSTFSGEKEGHVVIVFVPVTVGGAIDRELALDSVRALESLVWRYGGHSLECEILSGVKLKGRISISIKVSNPTSEVHSDTGIDTDAGATSTSQ